VYNQANEEGEENQSKVALEELKQQIAKLQRGLWSHYSCCAVHCL